MFSYEIKKIVAGDILENIVNNGIDYTGLKTTQLLSFMIDPDESYINGYSKNTEFLKKYIKDYFIFLEYYQYINGIPFPYVSDPETTVNHMIKMVADEIFLETETIKEIGRGSIELDDFKTLIVELKENYNFS